MKKIIFLIIVAPFIFYNCSKNDPIPEDSNLENENAKDSTEIEVINNPNDTITKNILYVYNHDYVYNSYNNDYMLFEITDYWMVTDKVWEYDWYGNATQNGYGTSIAINATGERTTKNQYNQLERGFIDVELLIGIHHQDSTIYGEYYIDENFEGNLGGQLKTIFFYTDPTDKGIVASGYYDLAPFTKMNISKSQTPGYFTLTISEGNVFYQATQYTPLLNEKNMFQIDIRYKGELD